MRLERVAVTALGTDEIEPPPPSNCWCCGRSDRSGFVRLSCHAEVAICFNCLDWLNEARRNQIKDLEPLGHRSLWERIRRPGRHS
jgi:hypothetical protein